MPCLIRHVTHDAGGPVLCDRQLLHSRKDAVSEDNLPAHILSAVIGLMRPSPTSTSAVSTSAE